MLRHSSGVHFFMNTSSHQACSWKCTFALLSQLSFFSGLILFPSSRNINVSLTHEKPSPNTVNSTVHYRLSRPKAPIPHHTSSAPLVRPSGVLSIFSLSPIWTVPQEHSLNIFAWNFWETLFSIAGDFCAKGLFRREDILFRLQKSINYLLEYLKMILLGYSSPIIFLYF